MPIKLLVTGPVNESYSFQLVDPLAGAVGEPVAIGSSQATVNVLGAFKTNGSDAYFNYLKEEVAGDPDALAAIQVVQDGTKYCWENSSALGFDTGGSVTELFAARNGATLSAVIEAQAEEAVQLAAKIDELLVILAA